jgi:hypothetical protein
MAGGIAAEYAADVTAGSRAAATIARQGFTPRSVAVLCLRVKDRLTQPWPEREGGDRPTGESGEVLLRSSHVSDEARSRALRLSINRGFGPLMAPTRLVNRTASGGARGEGRIHREARTSTRSTGAMSGRLIELLAAIDRPSALAFVDRQIGLLLAYDNQHDSDLTDQLERALDELASLPLDRPTTPRELPHGVMHALER